MTPLLSSCPGFTEYSSIFRWLIENGNAEPEDGAYKSPDVKTTSLDLKISSHGFFGAGMTNPVAEL